MQHCCLEGKINAEKLDELYPIFINNLDNLYNECKKIYYAKIEKNNNNNNNNNNKNETLLKEYYNDFSYFELKKFHTKNQIIQQLNSKKNLENELNSLNIKIKNLHQNSK
jgi:hypothetical protein